MKIRLKAHYLPDSPKRPTRVDREYARSFEGFQRVQMDLCSNIDNYILDQRIASSDDGNIMWFNLEANEWSLRLSSTDLGPRKVKVSVHEREWIVVDMINAQSRATT